MGLVLRLTFLLPIALSAGCTDAIPEARCESHQVAALPMIEDTLAKITGSLVVSVEVGDRFRTMLIDTGGAQSMLDPSVAASFDVKFTGSFYRLGLDAEPVDKVATVHAVRIGPRRFGDASFIVAPIGWRGVDGTLGANWLRSMNLEIAPEDGKIVFYEADHCGADAIRWPEGRPTGIPIRRGVSDGQLTISAELAGRRITALVDTGSPDTVLSLDAAKRLFGIGPDSPGILPGLEQALKEGTSEPSWRYRFSRLAVGGIVFDHPWVTLAHMAPGEPELIIGMEHLRRLHLFLAPSDGLIYAAMAPEARPSGTVTVADYLHSIEALIDRQRIDDAAIRLDALLESDPDNATAHMLRAALYDAKGDRKPAAQEVEWAIRLDPEFGGAYLVRSRLDAEAGNYERAYADADKAVRLLPEDAAALNTRCWYGAISGRLDSAMADCNAALALTPRDPNILDSRALVHLKAGHLDRAVADYDAALAIDPKLASSLYGRGVVRRRQGDEAAAQADIAAATRVEPDIAETFGK